ncbi:energy-coupling factor transporter transmembrane protein EcfT [uncultured Victivallis sp.]|uniref:energy-coupling factor transporter transmembrane component T family protein n=1 Tax=uncultured Victivallis sp. TaxID=354118 RepID=UPI0025EC0F62|nr:energy-coupling factor transporter transmembrane component T [uncultured Victivallis sp.]
MTGPVSCFFPVLSGSAQRGVFGRIAPLPKVCLVLGFLVLAVSFDRYDWLGCTLFAAVPFLLARIGGVSPLRLLRRTALALPFVLCAAAANLLFDRELVDFAGGATLPGGILSFWVLAAKTLATTGMVLLLAETTSATGISGALVRLHVPCILILQIQLLLRYLVLTAEEARNLANGYFLRNPECRIIPVRDWGMLCGRLFLRSVERAEAVYRAMQCRLFHAGKPLEAGEVGSFAEWGGCILLFGVLCLMRGTLS